MSIKRIVLLFIILLNAHAEELEKYIFLPYQKNFTKYDIDKEISNKILNQITKQFLSEDYNLLLDTNTISNKTVLLEYKKDFEKQGYNGPSILYSSPIHLNNDVNATLFIYEFWNSWKGPNRTIVLSKSKNKNKLVFDEIKNDDKKLEYTLDNFLIKNFLNLNQASYRQELDNIFIYKKHTYFWQQDKYYNYGTLYRVTEHGLISVSRIVFLPDKEEIPKLSITYSLMYKLVELAGDFESENTYKEFLDFYFIDTVPNFLVRPWTSKKLSKIEEHVFSKQYKFMNDLMKASVSELTKFYVTKHSVNEELAKSWAEYFVSKIVSFYIKRVESTKNPKYTILDIPAGYTYPVDCNKTSSILQKNVCMFPELKKIYQHSKIMTKPYPMFLIIENHKDFFENNEQKWEDNLPPECFNLYQKNLESCIEENIKQRIYFLQSLKVGHEKVNRRY